MSATPRRITIGLSEILNFVFDSFCSNKMQFTLTALAIAVGTASVILVATIGLTGKQYALNQIQAIGANLIDVEYESGGNRITNTASDALTIDDMLAVVMQTTDLQEEVKRLGDEITAGLRKVHNLLLNRNAGLLGEIAVLPSST